MFSHNLQTMLLVHYIFFSVELLFYGERLKCQIVFDGLIYPLADAYYYRCDSVSLQLCFVQWNTLVNLFCTFKKNPVGCSSTCKQFSQPSWCSNKELEERQQALCFSCKLFLLLMLHHRLPKIKVMKWIYRAQWTVMTSLMPDSLLTSTPQAQEEVCEHWSQADVASLLTSSTYKFYDRVSTSSSTK